MDKSATQAITPFGRYAFLLALLPFPLLFLFFLAVPLASLVFQGLVIVTPHASVAEGYFFRVVAFTYLQALLSTLLSLVLGACGAYVLFENRSERLPALSRLSLVCFSLPSLIVVLGILAVWGRSGWWNRSVPGLSVDVYGLTGVVIANAFFNFPLFLLGIGAGLRGLDRRFEMTALAYGASRLRTFIVVTLPRVWPSLRSALVLCFLYSSATSFVVALFLGGGPRSTTLEVAIYQAMKMSFDPGLASRLALVSIAVSVVLYFLFLRKDWFSASAVEESLTDKMIPLYAPRTAVGRVAAWVFYAAMLTALVLAPLLSVVSEGAMALSGLEGSVLLPAVLQSIQLALLAAVFAVPTALFFAYVEKITPVPWLKSLLGFLPGLPLAASSLLLSVGLLLTYPEWMASQRGALWPIAMVQAFGALPLVHRTVRDGLFRIPEALRKTAVSLGASPYAVFRRVELPLLTPALLTGFLVAVASSLGEVAAVLLFAPGEVSTLSVELFRAVGRYKFSDAFGLAVVLIALLAVLSSVTFLTSGRKRVAHH